MAPRGLTAFLFASLAVFAVHVAVAFAGAYHVYSCRTPLGEVAPTDGWSAGEHPPYDPTSNTCESGGGLVAALEAGYEHLPNSETDKATWAFTAPKGETITGATLWRNGNTLGGSKASPGYASYLFWISGGVPTELNPHFVEKCVAGEGCLSRGISANPFAEENRVIAPNEALNGPYLSVNTYCGSPTGASCPINEGGKIKYDSIIELLAADIVLSQPNGPTVSAVGGGLAEDATAQGTSDVSFHAADSGSGVYEALFTVDGKVTGRTVLNENGGRCRDVGRTSDGLAAFLYTQPCPAAASADLPFDTTALANGVHHLVVSVTDAAGNAAVVLDREIAVANPLPPGAGGPPPPGSPGACTEDFAAGATSAGAGGSTTGAGATGGGGTIALDARFAHHAGARWRSRYGVARTLYGRLTGPGGAALAGAQLEVCELPAYAGAQPVPLGLPRTDAAGRFALALPRHLPSCRLRVAYRAAPGALAPAAARTLTLTVPAALVLHVTPHLAPSQGAIRFAGRLLGGPLPPGGKPLVFEARAPGGRWLEFHVVHTGVRGRFAYLYRFRLPGPASYQFRVLSESEADFPFATGASGVVDVRER
jgi:hypothetical protein